VPTLIADIGRLPRVVRGVAFEVVDEGRTMTWTKFLILAALVGTNGSLSPAMAADDVTQVATTDSNSNGNDKGNQSQNGNGKGQGNGGPATPTQVVGPERR